MADWRGFVVRRLLAAVGGVHRRGLLAVTFVTIGRTLDKRLHAD